MKGIACPLPGCAGNTRVVDSRIDPRGIRRRRLCIKCKHRFNTFEVHDFIIEQIEQAERLQHTLNDFLRPKANT